jgi:hypothetical protein
MKLTELNQNGMLRIEMFGGTLNMAQLCGVALPCRTNLVAI